MKKALIVLVVAASLWAQQKKEDQKADQVTKVFEIKNGNAQRIADTLTRLGAEVRWSPDVNMISVRADRGLMPALEQVVQRLDTLAPSVRNVELTVYLLEASQETGPEGALPADLQPTVKQLKGVFAYQGFRVLDTLLLRGREGQYLDVTGRLASGQKPELFTYVLRLRPSVRTEGKERLIRLDNVSLSVNVSGGRVGLSTDLDVKEGQKVVVGKTGLEGSQKALIMVVSGKIVE